MNDPTRWIPAVAVIVTVLIAVGSLGVKIGSIEAELRVMSDNIRQFSQYVLTRVDDLSDDVHQEVE